MAKDKNEYLQLFPRQLFAETYTAQKVHYVGYDMKGTLMSELLVSGKNKDFVRYLKSSVLLATKLNDLYELGFFVGGLSPEDLYLDEGGTLKFMPHSIKQLKTGYPRFKALA